jgi:hypothetical protein
MAKLKDTEAALKQFEEAAIGHSEATEQGNYKKANKNYIVIIKAIALIKEYNKIISLSVFLDHPSDGVKCWAAAYLLPVEEQKANTVLEKIAKGGGVSALDAETTLSEWKKGNLEL